MAKRACTTATEINAARGGFFNGCLCAARLSAEAERKHLLTWTCCCQTHMEVWRIQWKAITSGLHTRWQFRACSPSEFCPNFTQTQWWQLKVETSIYTARASWQGWLYTYHVVRIRCCCSSPQCGCRSLNYLWHMGRWVKGRAESEMKRTEKMIRWWIVLLSVVSPLQLQNQRLRRLPVVVVSHKVQFWAFCYSTFTST